MAAPDPSADPWRWPTVFLWAVFFAAGIYPEGTYHLLRWAGGVTPYNAIVNSYFIITLGLTCFVCLFAYHRCREAGLGVEDALGRGTQLGTAALLAFLPVPIPGLPSPQFPEGFHYSDIPIPMYRWLVIGITVFKAVAWLYLYSIFVRYHLTRGHRVFAGRGCANVDAAASSRAGAAPLGEERRIDP